MLKFIDVEFGSSRYKELLDLRYKILLQPLGLKFLDSYREEEASYLHIGCIESSTDELIGGLILAPIDAEEIRVMQVAVDVVHQGEGIGRKLIEHAIKTAKEIGYDVYPIENLKEIYEHSCELRFISNWKLTKNYVTQFEDCTIE